MWARDGPLWSDTDGQHWEVETKCVLNVFLSGHLALAWLAGQARCWPVRGGGWFVSYGAGKPHLCPEGPGLC